MKKSLLIFILIALSIFSLGTAAQAGIGNLFYIDYMSLEDSDLGSRSNLLGFGGHYNYESLIFGADYALNTSALSKTIYSLYGGYDLLPDDAHTFAVIAGYTDWKDNIILGRENISSLGIGFISAADYDNFYISLLYIYGLKNNYEIDGITAPVNVKDASYLQFNTDYFFSDGIGLDLVYHTYAFKLEDGFKWRDSGLGLGMVFKFE